MLSSPNYIHPDVTLRLDRSGIIERAVFFNALAGELAASWVGRRWEETLSERSSLLEPLIDEAWRTGVSRPLQLQQRLDSGRELSVEYTALRLGSAEEIIAIGRSVNAVEDVRSRIISDKEAQERTSWKLRELGARPRASFETPSRPAVLIRADDLRIIEANPAAIALGVSVETPLLSPSDGQFDVVRDMLARLHDEEMLPSFALRLGPEQTRWLVRASLVTEWMPLYVLNLVPASPVSSTVPRTLDKAAMREIVGDAVAAVERSAIIAALGTRTKAEVAELLKITLDELEAKLSTGKSGDSSPRGSR